MKIVLTGGGSAGHIIPNIALIHKLKEKGYEVSYVGTSESMECELVKREGIKFQKICAGKLRRYFDFKNFTDILKIIQGLIKSIIILKKENPNVVFSKGGFVSCPVVWAAWLLQKPVILHESDVSLGLANRLSLPFARKICVSFPETQKRLNSAKCVLTGIPVRENLFSGNLKKGYDLCNFDSTKPTILVMGGSLGSKILNDYVKRNLKLLLNKFQICHICGKDGLDEPLRNIDGYKQFEFVYDEIAHLFCCADIIISRAGATTLFEILALEKPSFLIPLSKRGSRGDQILNAKSFENKKVAIVVEELDLTDLKFIQTINLVYDSREILKSNIKNSRMNKGLPAVLEVIESIIVKRTGTSN